MITSPAWSGKRYAVLGLARSGAATVEALLASGADVVAWDSDPAKRDELRSSRVQPRGLRAEEERPSFSLGTNGLEVADFLQADLSGFDAVVVSPGVPLNTHPIAAAARAAGVSVIGDIELFAQARASLPPHKVVGITGTNGKSTTTALVHHILREAGVQTTMGGNIGLPILAQEPLPEGGVYVLELSSYQIDLTQSLDCDVAVLLNVTPDHLDRYEDFEAYRNSKLRLLSMQSADHIGVFNETDNEVWQVLDRLDLGTWNYSGETLRLYDPSHDDPLAAYLPASLRGPHNLQNARVAQEVAELCGVSPAQFYKALSTFAGLAHRMELIRTKGRVCFVNDSKATNPTSTAPALAAFDAVHWILGGRAKSDDLDACAPHFDHVRAAYAIGEAGPRFVEILAPHMPVSDCGTLDVAVRSAAAAALPGEVVLLSPACASFDQFSDFEARGDAFRAAVRALA